MHPIATGTGPAAQISGRAVATSGMLLAPTVSGCNQDTRTRSPSGSLDYTGQPVTWLVEQHERPVHLIVVGRDQFGSQYPHPTMQIDGTWIAGMTYPQQVDGGCSLTLRQGPPLPGARHVSDGSSMTPKRGRLAFSIRCTPAEAADRRVSKAG